MYNYDAEGARAVTEQAKKDEKFRDIMEGINIEINDSARSTSLSTSVRLNADEVSEFGEAILENLHNRDMAVKISGDNRLLISWEQLSSEEE